MSVLASQYIGQLATGFADEVDEAMKSEELALAAMGCVWTTKGVHWHVGTSGRAAKSEMIGLPEELFYDGLS